MLAIFRIIDDFVWIQGVTPLSSYGESAAITAAYLLAIYGIQASFA
jgi:hypothetical protein